MTNSVTVMNRILSIGEVSGRKDKEVLMKGYLEEDLFRAIMVQALDPMITFGIKDLSFLDEVGDKTHNPEGSYLTLTADDYACSSFFRTLHNLSDRTVTGNAAKTAIREIAAKYCMSTYGLLIMILSKDLRVNAGAGTVNRVRPGTLFSFDVMLAAKFDEAKIKFPIRVEPKYDGMRLLAIGDADGFEFHTRSGIRVDSPNDGVIGGLVDMYEAGIDVWKQEGKMVFDGELMGEDFRDTMKQGRKKGHVFEDGRFYVFDAFPLEVFQNLRDAVNPSEGYEKRRSGLYKVYSAVDVWGETPRVILPPSYLARDMDEVTRFYDSVRGRGLEGLILKRLHGKYHPRRNVDWMKMKGQEEADVIVTGVEEGTGKYEGMLGAIIVDFNGVKVNVGSGFSDDQRQSLWKEHLSGELHGKVAEVWFHEVTPDKSMRHPRFKWFRDDKDAYAVEADAHTISKADGFGEWA